MYERVHQLDRDVADLAIELTEAREACPSGSIVRAHLHDIEIVARRAAEWVAQLAVCLKAHQEQWRTGQDAADAG